MAEGDRQTRRTWVGLFVIALLIRGAWGVAYMSRAAEPTALEFPDEEQYWRMAVSLRNGEGLRDELGFQATRMPLYPGFLALFAGMDSGIMVARVVQWFIGALGSVFAAGLAATVFDSRRIGTLAGLIFACDPFFIFFSSLLLTETLFVTLLCGLWWSIVRVWRREGLRLRTWIVVGIVSALCIYTRESSVGLVILAMMITVAIKRFQRKAVIGMLLAGSLVCTSLCPWALRNHRVLGSWCWMTTRGGISLYDGVRPGAIGESDLGDVKQMSAVQGLSEKQWDEYFRGEAFRLIREDPGRIASLALAKIGRMWNPVPNVETYRSTWVRLVAAVWMFPIMLLALIGVVAWPMTRKPNGWKCVLLLLLPAIYLTLLHALFVGSVRYRLAAMPMLEILSAYALAAVILGRRPRLPEGRSE